jgi:hypothetical protein
MGHESQIELWSPNLTTFCFVGFGTDRLRRQEAMKTADRENPIHGATWPRNRAHGAVGQNRTSSIEWAEKQENFQPQEKCFFLTSPFIELTRCTIPLAILIPIELQRLATPIARQVFPCPNPQRTGALAQVQKSTTWHGTRLEPRRCAHSGPHRVAR